MSVARGKTAEPFVVKTPYPDPNETARRLGMSKKEVARVERLVTAATRPKSSPPPLLESLRQLLRRVKQGKTVFFVYPGLPLYAFVPVSDRRMIEQVERMRNPSRRKRRTVSMTVEELAQGLGGMLPPKTVSKRPAGKAASGSPVIRKAAQAARAEPSPGARTKRDMERDQTRSRSGAAPVGASHRRRRPDPAVSLSRTKAGTPGRPSRKRKAAATGGHRPHA